MSAVHATSGEQFETLARAVEANYRAQIACYRASLEPLAARDPEFRWFLAQLPAPAARREGSGTPPAAEIARAMELAISAAGYGRSPIACFLPPGDLPAATREELRARGWSHQEDLYGMVAETEDLDRLVAMPLPASASRTRTVADAADLATFLDVFLRGFRMPARSRRAFDHVFGEGLGASDSPWRHYLTVEDQGPGEAALGTASLFIHQGVAGLYNVSTIPRARRRGLGTLATLVAFRDARDLGHRIAVLVSSREGLPLYRRLGLREVVRVSLYTPSPAAGRGGG